MNTLNKRFFVVCILVLVSGCATYSDYYSSYPTDYYFDHNPWNYGYYDYGHGHSYNHHHHRHHPGWGNDNRNDRHEDDRRHNRRHDERRDIGRDERSPFLRQGLIDDYRYRPQKRDEMSRERHNRQWNAENHDHGERGGGERMHYRNGHAGERRF